MCGLGASGSGQDPMTSSYELGNKPSGSARHRGKLNDC
jgi:hypothetical protein